MSWGVVAVGGTMVAGQYMAQQGANRAANAAGNAANAQLEEARRQSQRAEQLGADLQTQVRDLSAATPQELAAFERSIQSASNLVARDKKLLDAIDPALMEASTQALQLLRGDDAAALGPVKAQRAMQRQQLLRTLREQMGPGAETSSAGQKALQQFDMETTSLMNQVQQGTLSMLLGTAQTQRAQSAQSTGAEINAFQNAGIGFGNISNRQTQAALGAGIATLGAVTGTGQSITQSAGAPFVQAQLQGQAQQAMGNQLTNVGATVGMYGLMNGGFGKKTG